MSVSVNGEKKPQLLPQYFRILLSIEIWCENVLRSD